MPEKPPKGRGVAGSWNIRGAVIAEIYSFVRRRRL